MIPHPPPDVPCEEIAIRAEEVYLHTVGKTGGTSAEVLALAGGVWYRFDYKAHARVVRKFWTKNASKRGRKTRVGIVESVDGFGPFLMEGIVVGHDSEIESAQDASGKTTVLRDVSLKGNTDV